MAASKKKPDRGDSSESNSGDVPGASPVEQQAVGDQAGAMREEAGQVTADSPPSELNPGITGTGPESGCEDSLLAGVDPAENLGLDSKLEPTPPLGNGNGNGNGVDSLFHDHERMDQLFTALVVNRTVDTLADSLAERLRHGLERSPQFRERLINAVMSNNAARTRLIKTLVKSLV